MHVFSAPSRRLFQAGLMALALAPALTARSAADDRRLEFRHGDRVCIIGNTLAERLQHAGWLETLLQARFPRRELVFRNLGYSGDEITLRLRSANFGSPHDHLNFNKADVIFAFFGFNESFKGQDGLYQFIKDLEEFVKETLSKKYNGESAPRLVLFSPIAFENFGDRNLPDGKEHNRNIKLYTDAMAQVASTVGIPFVDLFTPTLALYEKTTRPLTINGMHLNDEGNRLLAPIIEQALLRLPSPREPDWQALAKFREAVLDKNFHWFERYRVVDGYNVYGGRSSLKYNEQTNREVMQREMEILDVMTANRDKRIWALARGEDLEVDDSNTPEFLETVTNKPGSGPGGRHLYLGGEEAIGKMKAADGMKVELVATEERFPDLRNPVQMAFDTRGRLFVAVMPTYPHWRPKDERSDKILILEDHDGDGAADSCKVFADEIHVPTGLEFWGGGLFVGQQPDLVFLKDTDGDDRADVRERVLHGIDSADTHHALNSFVLDPGGALYFQEGTFHHTQVETLSGPERCANGGVFRYEPRTKKFEVYVSYGFANPHGHVFDRWGQDFVTDGTSANSYFAAAYSGRVEFPRKHPGMRTFYQRRTRPCPATAILSSRHFPDENQGNFLVANVIGFLGILQYRIHEEGSGFGATEVEPIVQSSDPNFRPADMEVGPDGALYFLDWHNAIIGHMQHHLRDPSRDHQHGRVYRVVCADRPFLEPPKIAGAPVAKLVSLLESPEDGARYRAKIELSARDSDEVIAAVERWRAGLDSEDPEYEHHMLEALWVHQHHNVVNEKLLARMLGSSDHRARAAATRVLCYWRDRVGDALGLLKKLAADEHPRVRLEAVRAASFFKAPEAVEVPLISAVHETDYYLDYTRNETMKTLEPYWKKALADGHRIPVTSDAGSRFLLERISTADLLKMERSRGVHLELLLREGVREEYRREALGALAKLDGKSEPRLLLETIRQLDAKGRHEDVLYDLARLLAEQSADGLAAVRSDLEKLARDAQLPVNRQIGYVALIAADGAVDRAWKLGSRSAAALRDFLDAMPLITDPSLRATLYPRVEPLLHGLPAHLAPAGKKAKGTQGRYVRVELPGRRRILTLAEVEVFAAGENVARRGKASHKNTDHGGHAARGIDGNTHGSYGSGGQTHTRQSRDPWWEVDLGAEYAIESIRIWNRTEGDLRQRLADFTLLILDADRQEVFRKEKNPAPDENVAFEIGGGGPEAIVRRAAMQAITHVRGKEAETFATLAGFVQEDVDRAAAIRALHRIPKSRWPREGLRPLVDSILAHATAIPAEQRTSRAALDALQLGDELASFLPAGEAKEVRAQLGELGVRVIRLGTLPHQMLYDKDSIVVAVGKPVEIIFENSDIMPHNLVITRPGALEEVGLAAEATATEPDAPDREYVPRSNKILVKSKLLQARESEKLSFTAPSVAGVYPYVCTYPGHWRRMFGSMYVVEDLDAYLADPEGYLAAHPLPIEDELLKVRRPRTEWKFEDLAASLEEIDNGRSYGNGVQMFEVANCTACHRLNGVGFEFGPDLAQLDPKRTRADILRHILEPSAEIDEKFFSYTFVTKTGKVLSGLVLDETPQRIKVIENPLAQSTPVELKPSDVVKREKSPVSIMPKGMLAKLTRDEILDLIAYLEARGNRQHKLFQGGCGHERGD